jgi:hypothetical protein
MRQRQVPKSACIFLICSIKCLAGESRESSGLPTFFRSLNPGTIATRDLVRSCLLPSLILPPISNIFLYLNHRFQLNLYNLQSL